MVVMLKGVWDYIPRIQYNKYRGYTTKIVKTNLGYLCGYVLLPKSFKLNVEWYDLGIVHGGITYHKDNVIGFDCAHYIDYIPAFIIGEIDNYKDEDFVNNELRKLVNTLIAMNK